MIIQDEILYYEAKLRACNKPKGHRSTRTLERILDLLRMIQARGYL